MRIRVLPVTMFLMLSLLAYKGIGMVVGEIAYASSPKKTEEKKPEKTEEHGGGKEGEKKDEAESTIRIYQERPPEQESLKYTSAEKDLLTKLAERRVEIDKYESQLDLKANMLESTSKKLDEKLVKLQELKAATEKLLVTYKEQEDVKIKSLVKIYESMKPKQAAAVFEKLDKDILLEIVDKMAEKKASLVLAQMNPEKAKEVTEQLANQRSLASEMGVNPNAIENITN